MARWRQFVRFVQDGQQVNAGNTNRPIGDVQDNVAYLRTLFDDAELGQALFARSVALHEDCLVGQAVYWNETEQYFAPAKATASVSADTGIQLDEQAQVVGVIYRKENVTTGDVLLLGYAAIDLSAAVDGDVDAGMYFLSGTVAGALTTQQPDIGIGVLFCDGHGNVVVNPQHRNFLDDHRHYRLQLYARPAGTVEPPEVGDVHEISGADDTLPGWLPASHERFAGLAPEGAKFGYNFAAHDELNELWPPMPLTAASIFVERPQLDRDVFTEVLGATLMDPRVVQIDANGIWWMTNVYNQAPWDTDYSSTNSLYGSSVSYDDTHNQERIMRIWFCFAIATYANNRNVVTRLTPAEGSPVTLTNCNGDASTVGDLILGIDLDFLLDDDADEAGALVIKTLDQLTFKSGYVTEGLIAGNNVSLTSTNSRTSGADTIHRGVVSINVDLDPPERELAPEVVKLGGALERTGDDVPYIGLPTGRSSAVRLRFNVPPAGLPANPRFKMRVLLLGTTTGTLPDLAMTYKVLPDPGNATVTLDALEEIDLVIDTETSGFTGGDIIKRETDEAENSDEEAYEVQAGDTIYVTISREDDDYAGEVGLIRMQGVLYAG